jgi:hypothetical protein
MLDMKDCDFREAPTDKKTNQNQPHCFHDRSIDLSPGSGTRAGQEGTCSHLLLLAILDELVGRGGLGDVAGDIVEIMRMV